MADTSPPKAPLRFYDAAKLIAPDEKGADWLSYGLCFWVWPQLLWRPQDWEMGPPPLGMSAAIRRVRRGRAEVVETLSKRLPKIADSLSEVLSDPIFRHFLTSSALDAKFGQLPPGSSLYFLAHRAREAARSSELVEDGKAKGGRGKILIPGQIDEKDACAATVAVAWEMVRGVRPGARRDEAAEAAEILFALGSVTPGRYEQVKRRKLTGEKRTTAWRQHFEKANGPDPAIKRQDQMLAERLAAMRDMRAADPAGSAFSSVLAFFPP